MDNSKVLSSEALTARWRIEPLDLLMIVRQGTIEFEVDGLIEREGYAISHSLIKSVLELSELKKLFFKKTDIEIFEKEHPEYKPQESPYITSQGEIPPYLDKKNKHFSKELSIAIETWMAIYGSNGILKPKKKHRKQIIAYLKKQHPELGNTAVNRIAIMVNIDTSGAQKTSYYS